MEQRKLGKSGLEVSALGLGCMGMSDFYAHGDEAESMATIHAAIDAGVTLFDTADMYGPFKNEELVGRAIEGRRERLVLATKFGIVRDQSNAAMRGFNGKPDYVRRSCEGSLKRLGVETIDLYYLHRVDPATPIEETVGAMAGLVKEGKVRFLGLSEVSPQTLERACRIHPIAAVQSEYSLWSRDPEDGILEECRKLGAGFVAYSPLGRGFLSGKIRRLEDLAPDDWRRSSPRFQDENFQKNLDLVDRITELAARKKCTPSQLALAWVLAQGGDVVAIFGTSRRGHLAENLRALEVRLTPAELKAIDEVAPEGIAAGSRYAKAEMTFVNA